MRYIVFGGGGFIGSYLIQRLKKDNHYVIAVDRHTPRHINSVADEFHVCKDIGNEIPINIKNIDGVFQLCAFSAGSQVLDSGTMDADIFINNMLVNISVVKFCVKNNINKIFFSSSVCVYKGSDTYTCDPVNIYGWEKYSAEKLYTAVSRQYGIDIRIGRIFNIYGPTQEFCGGKEQVIPSICYKVYQSHNMISLHGNGSSERCFLHVEDCADAIVSVFNSDINVPVNIGSDAPMSIRDIATLIATQSKKEVEIEFMSPNDPPTKRICDNSLLKTTGWIQRITLVDGILELYNYVSKTIEDNRLYS